MLFVRKRGGFDPATISSAVLDFDATDAATITTSGSSVTDWDSRIGSAVMTQPNAALQPSTGLVTIGGKNAVSFDGTEALSAGTFAMPAAGHIFLVARATGRGSPEDAAEAFITHTNLFQIDAGGTSGQYRYRVWTTKHSVMTGAGSDQLNTDVLVEYSWETATDTVFEYLAGSQIGTQTNYTADHGSGNLYFGANTAFNKFVTGRIGQMVMCNAVLSGADLTYMRDGLTAKWGL